MKKALFFVVLPLFLVSILSAQSLAELSKKEKERRDSLKGKQAILITNADLGKTKKKAGIETPPPPPPATTESQADPEAEQPSEGEPNPEAMSQSAESGETREMADGYRVSLETRYAQAKEYADLLELKMAALWQEFYSMDDMTSRDTIQQEIALTFDKLGKAREDENTVKKELDDYIARVGKEDAQRK